MPTRTTVPEEPTLLEQLFALLRARLLTVVFVVAGTAAVLGYIGALPDFNRTHKLVLYSFVAAAPYGYIAGVKLSGYFVDETWIWVVDLIGDPPDVSGELYRIPFSDFHRLEIQNGEIAQLSPQLYSAKRVDLEEMTADGTWRGTLDDPDLLRSLQAVHEIRNELEAQAQRGFVLETSQMTIVRTAVRETVRHILEVYQEGALPDDGEALQATIDRHLEQFGLEDKLDDLKDRTEAPGVPDDPTESEGPEGGPRGESTNGDLEKDVGFEKSEFEAAEPQEVA